MAKSKYFTADDFKKPNTQTATKSKYFTAADFAKGTEASTTSKSKYFTAGDFAENIANNAINRINALNDNATTLVKDYESRFGGRKGNYEDAYVSDSADYLNAVTQQRDAYKQEYNDILSYLDKNAKYLNPEWVDSVKKHLTENDVASVYDQVVKDAEEDNAYWNSFGDGLSDKILKYATFGQYDAESAYKTEQRQYGYYQKYQGKSLGELNGVLNNLEEGPEKNWLTKYAASVENDELSKADIGVLEKELEELKKEKAAYLEDQYKKKVEEEKNKPLWQKLGDALKNDPDDNILLGGLNQASGITTSTPYDKLIAEKEQQIASATYIQGYNGYMGIKDREDFNTISQYVSTRTEVPLDDAAYKVNMGVDGEGNANMATAYNKGKLFGDFLYDYINGNEDALAVATENDVSDYSYFLGHDQGFLREMTDDEIKTYNAYYHLDKINGTNRANEFLSFIESDLNSRRRMREQEEWAADAQKHPIANSLFSVAISPLKILSAAGQVADYLHDGKVDQNAGYNRFSYIPSAIREQVASDIAKSGKWGEVGSWTYQLGMSMGDFLVTSAVSGGSQALSLTLMGSGAMADTVISAKDRGLSDDQAMILGVVAGGAEIITEKFSLDALFKGDMSKGAMRYILTNAFTEGTEEVSSSLINTFADILVSKDKSEWAMAIEEYMANNPGASEREAFNKVLTDTALSLGLDFLGGSLMGGVMGSVGAGINYVTNARPGLQANIDAVNQYGGSTNELINEGLLSDTDSDSYDLAQYYQKKTEKGKKLSGYEIRNLVDANEKQFIVENAEAQAKTLLTELGETGNVNNLANLVAKYVSGQELTRAEKSTLTRSEHGAEVAKKIKEMASASKTKAENSTKPFDVARKDNPATYKPLEEKVSNIYPTAESGKATIHDSNETVNLDKVEVVDFVKDKETGKVTDMVLKVDGKDVNASDIDFADDSQSYLYAAVSNIENITPAAATAIVRDYDPSSGLSVSEYLNGMDEAYTYGYYGYNEADLKAGNFAPKLTNEQMMSAYRLGQSAKKNSGVSKAEAFKRMRTAVEAEAAKQAESGTVLNETGETVKVKAIASKEGGKMTLELENGEIVDADKVTLSEDEALIHKAISEMDISAKEANKLLQGYDGSISAEAYASGISEAYNYGRQGVAYKSIDSQGYAAAIPVQARKTAYQMGRKALETEKNRSYNSTTNEKERVSDGTGENVHLRRGTQRTDSESSDKSVRGMEETPGGVQKRNEAGRSESNRADSQADEGRVNAGDLGIPGGTVARNLTAVSSDYSADTKEAAATAAEQGLEAVFFTGNNLRIEYEGKVIEARACIVGKKIYVRADHPHFTATQLTKHELTHDKIDRGEIVTKNVYDMMVAYYGEAKVKDIIQAYAEAYDMGYDTQKAADAVFVEIVCDSEAGINYFTMEEKAGTPHFMENVGIATQADMNSRDSRGPPADGVTHFSRETERFFQHFTGAIKTDEYIWLSNVEAATIKSNIKSRATYLNQDASRGLVWAHSAKKEYAYVFNCNSDYSVTVTDILDAESDIAIINAMTERMENYGRTVTRIQRNSGTNGQQRNGNQRSNAGSSSNAQTSQSQGTKGMVSQASQSNQQGSVGTGNQNSTNSGADKTRNAQKVKFSREATETIINQSMTMQQAKDMVQRAFVTGQIKEFYDGQYRNGDEWLAGEGVDEVALYIENEYAIVNKYLNHIQEYIDDDIMLQDILNAYLGKTLTGKVKQPTQWMDLSHDVAVADKRFYAPKAVKDANAKLEVAKQRITNSNREEVTKARAEILLYAHNKGAAETLGLTEAELNRMLRSWSGYRSEARDISRRINSGVALSNRWSGIENCSWLSKAQVSKDELARLVKSVDGDSQGFERNYIARTMLALDTHIDWSDIKFIFTGVVDPNRRSVRGTYNHREKTIKANYSSPDTVAHEMGHALDHKWANELGFGDNVTMTEGRLNKKLIKSEKARIWYDHFQEFIQDLTDSADISSSYTMDNGEVFARFVSTFVQWTDQTATGKQNYGYISSGRSDKFTANQYITFVKLLQEKAMLDSEALATENQDVKFSREFSLSDLNRQINELTNKRKEILASAEYDRIVGKISTATGEALDAVIQEYNEFTESSGLYDVTKQLATLEEQAEKTRKQQEADYLSKADAERKAAIEASGLTEAEYDTKQAVKEFGYTPYYYDAGYIVANGKLLNFSGEKGRHFGSRGQDHRAIGIIYDDLSGTQAMVKFMNEGNIRIMDESPGLDISTMPTKEQMATIKKYVASKHGEIYLDISDKNGNNVASIEYDRGTSPSIVELDIKEYFEKGKIPTKFEPKFSREFIQAQMTEQEKHLQQVNKALEKDNAKLQEDNQYLKQLLKLQREVTGGTKFTKSSVEAMARQLKTKANASGEAKELAAILNNFYEFIATSKELSWEDVMEQAEVAADWLMDNKREGFVRDEYAQRVLDDLLGRSFYLDDVQKGEAAHSFGSYQAFRQKVLGAITASDKANMSLDELWKELSEAHPYYFPTETNSGDMVQGIVDVINTLRTAKGTDAEAMHYNSEEMEKQQLLHDVYDSFWRVSTLRTVADSKQKEINRLKSMHYTQMDQVKQAHKEATKKLEAEYRQRMDALRAEYKARTEEKIRKVKDANRDARQRVNARAEQTELRHKIRKAVRDLDKLLNRGNKKTNVKEDMKDFVSKALELADYLFTDHISNDDLVRNGINPNLMRGNEPQLVKETEEILSKLYDNADSLTDEEFSHLDEQRKKNMEKLRDLLTKQRNERLNTPVSKLFDDLVKAYASLKNSKQDAVKAAYSEELENSLRAMTSEDSKVKILENMRVADMTTEELNWLYRAYTMVLTNVRNANKAFANSGAATIEEISNKVYRDFSSRKIPEGKLAIAMQKLTNKIGWDYEKLYYALDRIGSEAFTELIMNLANSENIVMQDVIEAIEFRDKVVKEYGFNNLAVNKEIDKEFLDNTGKKFKLTLGQLMALYAYSRRDGAWDHIEYGGFVFGEASLTNPKPADAYKLTKAQCEAITDTLTKEQKAYVRDMQKYLSETMGEKGNEVSMLLYGIKMFGEENYFPIHIAGQFKTQANESQAKAAAGFSTMSNAGFTHAQNPNAKAPFVLEGFNEIWVDHVNEMSRYHGTVPALEDIRRVMNRSSYSDAAGESVSIRQQMENSFGKEAVEYFDNLYREANSGAITDKLQRVPKKLLSLFRKNSVAYSLSVIIQQPSAMVRAYAVIDKKYFGFKGVGALTSGVAKAVSSKWNPAYANSYNEMLKYAPGVTMAKEIGGFDTHTGASIREYLLDTGKSFKQSVKTENLKGKGKAVLGLVDDNAIANLPNVADKIAWIEIWNACKRETVAKHKDLATNSEEFMQIVGERFTEVIRATQVYDSIFAKSPMLKSKSLAVQYLVSFMNEPNTTINMVEKSIRDATKGDWKGGLRIAAAVTGSIIFNNVLKGIIYAMRDDDEDETYIEKYLVAVTGGMMDDFNPINYIPIARDVWSKVKGFDVERPDVAIISDAIDAYQAIAKYKGKDTEDMTEEEIAELDKKITDASWKLAGSLAAFFGIPVKNIYREIDGVIDHARIASANAGMTTASGIWDKVKEEIIDSIPFMNAPAKTDKLYDAIISGDKTYLERLKSSYKTDDAYQSAVRKALRENDTRIHEAALARYSGNIEEYKRIFREIQKEGKFSFDDIMSAVNSEVSAIEKKLEPDKATSQNSTGDFVEAVVMGNTINAEAMRDDIIAAKVANGKTQEEAEKEFASNVGTDIGKAYSSGLLDEAQAEKLLVEYAGKDEEEAASRVNYWAFCEEHQEYKDVLTEANVNDYQEFADPAEISLDVYAQYISGTKGLETIKDEWGDVEVSKRDQVLEVIDSLPITSKQKDALYLAAGYSESKIWDVPW